MFNKQGWHYPQQRFITLLEDVKPTIEGERPPEPFFFRAETGETVEFWHTNLVPNYYELDDFQVRTPTDILGQHIHLVKFDVTASDGAANGFNYEDGTFSPNEVQERIESINKHGGLFLFDPKTQLISTEQIPLKLSNYKEDYGNLLGKPPAGQNWNGAQTTIQRFGTDPLLNNQGEDRTLRTVFTHDHFGPSTHQQVGLYGAMLVEPSGTEWFDAVTREEFPSASRSDGGPTSWQAIIEGRDSVESFREFAIAVGDLQLAYKANSHGERQNLKDKIWFSIDSVKYQAQLDNGEIPIELALEFAAQGAPLTKHASLTVVEPGAEWLLMPNKVDKFSLFATGPADAYVGEITIDVKTLTMKPSWADFDNAIWPPTPAQLADGGQSVYPKPGPDPSEPPIQAPPVDPTRAPFPTVVSDGLGAGVVGIWVNNYRNEPLDSRLQQGSGNSSNATNPAFALSSIQRNNPVLNSQPRPGQPISDQNDFSFPKVPLLPRGKDGVGDTDPYTPLLRAYAGDNIEVRAIVGAVDSLHSFGIQGVNWNAEPSYTDSGFRDTQGMGISEHFEMLFKLPPATGLSQPVDRYYAPSTSSMGLNKGAWGIMRSYPQLVDGLATISGANEQPPQVAGFYSLPAGQVPDRSFIIEVSAVTGATGPTLRYSTPAGVVLDPLVLRAAAGDWIKVELVNRLDAAYAALFASHWTTVSNISQPSSQSKNSSSIDITGIAGTTEVGLNPRLISYDSASSSGLNVGQNATQTASAGQSQTYYWYAGNISLDDSNQRVLTPVEFGGVNLTPADLLLQRSYGAAGVLVVEPAGSSWAEDDNHSMSATIIDKSGEPMFTEIIVTGNSAPATTTQVIAGSEVRFRVLNPSASGAAGQVENSVAVITVEGHNWPEEPYAKDSTVIQFSDVSQTMGTQQVTAMESYNMLLRSAGGEEKLPGIYNYYYYHDSSSAQAADKALGSLQVISEETLKANND